MKPTDAHAQAVLAILQRETRDPASPAPATARGAGPRRPNGFDQPVDPPNKQPEPTE
jgi:hypothetical protein